MKRKLMFYFVVLILPQLGITSYADVLMLGAEKNPQGNYSLLQKYSTSNLQNQDHLSANNITFEIDNYTGTFQSDLNEGNPRFIIYAWSIPFHQNLNATVTYKYSDGAPIQCTYTIKPENFNNYSNRLTDTWGFDYAGISRPLTISRYSLTNDDFPYDTNHFFTNSCTGNLRDMKNGSITISLSGQQDLFIHPSTLTGNPLINPHLYNEVYDGNISRVELPFVSPNSKVTADSKSYDKDIAPILCSSQSSNTWRCPTKITLPDPKRDLVREEKIFSDYYQQKGFGSCGSCHVGGGLDLALLGFSDADIGRRASDPHIEGHDIVDGSFNPQIDGKKETDADIKKDIIDYISRLREKQGITEPGQLIDPARFRAFQPRFLVLGTNDNLHTICYPGLNSCNNTATGLITENTSTTTDPLTGAQLDQTAEQLTRDLTFGAYLSGQTFNFPANGGNYTIDISKDEPAAQISHGLMIMNPTELSNDSIINLQTKAKQMANQLLKVDAQLLRNPIPNPRWGEDDFFWQNKQFISNDPAINPSFNKMLPFLPMMNNNMADWTQLQTSFTNEPSLNNLWNLYNSLNYSVTDKYMNELLPVGSYSNSFSQLSAFNFMNMVSEAQLLSTWMLADHSELMPSPTSDQVHSSQQDAENDVHYDSISKNTALYRNLTVTRIPMWRVGSYLVQNGSQHPFDYSFGNSGKICTGEDPGDDCYMSFPTYVYDHTLKNTSDESTELPHNNSIMEADWQFIGRLADPSYNTFAASNAETTGDYANKLISKAHNNAYPIAAAFYTVTKPFVDRAENKNYQFDIANTSTGQGIWASNRVYAIWEHNYQIPNFWVINSANKYVHMSNWCENEYPVGIDGVTQQSQQNICTYANNLVVNTYKMALLNTLSELQQSSSARVFDRKQTYGSMLEMYGVLYDYFVTQKMSSPTFNNTTSVRYVSDQDMQNFKQVITEIHDLLAAKNSDGTYKIPNELTPKLSSSNGGGNLIAYSPELTDTVDNSGLICVDGKSGFQCMKSNLDSSISNTFSDVDPNSPTPPSGNCNPPVVNSKTVNEKGDVVLSWNQDKDANSFTVYSYNGTSILQNKNVTSFTDTSTEGKNPPFSYYLQTMCNNGSDSEKEVVNVNSSPTPPVTVCNPPNVNQNYINANGDVVLSWGQDNNAISYKVYNYNGKDTLQHSNATSYTDTSTEGKNPPFSYQLQTICNGKQSGLEQININN